jgi:hypothetical protein
MVSKNPLLIGGIRDLVIDDISLVFNASRVSPLFRLEDFREAADIQLAGDDGQGVGSPIACADKCSCWSLHIVWQ